MLHRSFPFALAPLLLLAAACGDDSGSTTAAGTGGSGGSGNGTGSGGNSAGSGGDSSSSGNPTTNTGPGSGGAGPSTGTDSTSTGTPCTEGTIVCDGATSQVCDGNGGFTDVEDCTPGVCIPAVGCTLCAPGSGSCNGNVSTVCNDDGQGFTTYTCDPEQGSTCDAGTGHCTGACSPELLGTSYIGCDYFPTVTDNSLLPTGTFAVAVANTSDQPANIKVHQGANLIVNTSVGANTVAIVPLPWVDALRYPTASTLVTDGAYRLRTTQPVTVYQYNPLEYSTPNGNTYTNDASLLLPTNSWTGNYRVAAKNSYYFWPGIYAVTASQDGTTVTLGPSATGGRMEPAGRARQEESARTAAPRAALDVTFALDVRPAVPAGARLDHRECTA